MVAGKLSHLAGEMDAAIGKKDLGLTNPAGIEDYLPGGRIAGVVLVADAKIVIAQGDPNRFTAPAHMDQPAPERKRAHEGGAGRRRNLGLEAPHKSERSSRDLEFRHADLRSVPPRIPRRYRRASARLAHATPVDDHACRHLHATNEIFDIDPFVGAAVLR